MAIQREKPAFLANRGKKFAPSAGIDRFGSYSRVHLKRVRGEVDISRRCECVLDTRCVSQPDDGLCPRRCLLLEVGKALPGLRELERWLGGGLWDKKQTYQSQGLRAWWGYRHEYCPSSCKAGEERRSWSLYEHGCLAEGKSVSR